MRSGKVAALIAVLLVVGAVTAGTSFAAEPLEAEEQAGVLEAEGTAEEEAVPEGCVSLALLEGPTLDEPAPAEATPAETVEAPVDEEIVAEEADAATDPEAEAEACPEGYVSEDLVNEDELTAESDAAVEVIPVQAARAPAAEAAPQAAQAEAEAEAVPAEAPAEAAPADGGDALVVAEPEPAVRERTLSMALASPQQEDDDEPWWEQEEFQEDDGFTPGDEEGEFEDFGFEDDEGTLPDTGLPLSSVGFFGFLLTLLGFAVRRTA